MRESFSKYNGNKNEIKMIRNCEKMQHEFKKGGLNSMKKNSEIYLL